MLDRVAVYTVDACDFGAGAYRDNSYAFVADVATENLRFEILVGPQAVVRIDNGIVFFLLLFFFLSFFLSSSFLGVMFCFSVVLRSQLSMRFRDGVLGVKKGFPGTRF